MKKLMAAVCACVCALGLFGDTLNVPSTDYPDIATAVAAAQSGDEIVIAKSTEPYVLAKKITLPTGVSVRGETGDFNDVVISGGGKLNGAFVVGINCAVSNITFTSFVMPGSSDAIISETGSGARYVDNCRFTANSGTSYGSILISNTQLSTYSRIVVDNCQLGHQCQSGLLCIQGLGRQLSHHRERRRERQRRQLPRRYGRDVRPLSDRAGRWNRVGRLLGRPDDALRH